MASSFTLFIGNERLTATKLVRDGYLPDVILCPPLTVLCNEYTRMVAIGKAATLFRHNRFHCRAYTCLNTGFVDVMGTHVLITAGDLGDDNHLRACTSIFQNKRDVMLDIYNPVPLCGSRMALTHTETPSYGRYFVFEPPVQVYKYE